MAIFPLFELLKFLCLITGKGDFCHAVEEKLPELQTEVLQVQLYDPYFDAEEFPTKIKLADETDLAGFWSTPAGLTGTRIAIAASAEGGYSVEFESWGCLGGAVLARQAWFENGRLHFDLPVGELMATYKTMYVAVLGGETYLVPSENVATFPDEFARQEISDGWLLAKYPGGQPTAWGVHPHQKNEPSKSR